MSEHCDIIFVGSRLGVGLHDVFRQADDMNHLYGTARMGFSSADSVVDPALTIYAPGLRLADRIDALARRSEL